MTYTSARRHLNRMREAIAKADYAFEDAGTLEADERIVIALAESLVEELAALTETITDESIFDCIGEPVTEAFKVAFMDARDKRDDRRSPDSRAAYAAEMERERA